jgi:hypothetical protein
MEMVEEEVIVVGQQAPGPMETRKCTPCAVVSGQSSTSVLQTIVEGNGLVWERL